MSKKSVDKFGLDAEYGATMDSFLQQVDSAIAASRDSALRLKETPSPSTAEEACLACRNAVQLLFFGRSEFAQDLPDRIQSLMPWLLTAQESLASLVRETNGDPTIAGYLKNIQMRERLLIAVQSDEPGAVRRLLKGELATASR